MGMKKKGKNKEKDVNKSEDSTPSMDIDINEENSCLDTEKVNDNEDNSNEPHPNKEEVWVKIESKKRYEVSILAENLPGKKNDEKIKNAYHIIDDASNVIGVKHIFITGKKRIVATFKNKESADKACEKNISEDNDCKFEKLIKKNENLDWQQRTIKIMDIPLNAKKDIIKNTLNKIGEVETISMRPSGMWYTALITFKSENTITELQNTWSISYFKDSMRIYPYKDYKNFYQQRNSYVLKLTNIPFGTTSYDLEDIITAVNGKTCFLARRKNSYVRTRIAYVAFENEESMVNAMKTNFALREKELFWTTVNTKTCNICGSPEHLAAKCEEKANRNEKKIKQQKFNGLYKKFHVPFKLKETKSKTYAEVTKQQQQKQTNNIIKPINKIGEDNFNKLLDLINTLKKDILQINENINNINKKIKFMETTTVINSPVLNNSTHNPRNDKINENIPQQPTLSLNQTKTNNKNDPSNNNKRRRPNTSSSSSSSDELEFVKQKQLEVSNQVGKIEDKLNQITSMLTYNNQVDETSESSSEDEDDNQGYIQTHQQ